MQRYLTIHGHFYQPPRENPWTETIEKQSSAHPYHDWNERINAECYTPNAFSRLLDAAGRIAHIVSNYASISFNFGPTLMSWLQLHAPAAYERILEADRESQQRFSGHGAAIAQAYNHIIMPLANERDRITQVRWGLADFRHRFQREPESMWMPETAVNMETLRALIDFGLKYVILSPFQAKAVRQLPGTGGASDAWASVENGEIDTAMPYRWFDRDDKGQRLPERSIDVFFYHAGLSRGVGFEHLLRDAGVFAAQVEGAFNGHNGRPLQLVSVATDGESYGHHETFGDMGLAYLLHIEAPRRSIEVTNFGAFLAKNPPTMEVELKDGPNGEGTAWSCAHGVGRWSRNCGCKAGGSPEWNQEWRAPLRLALDNLRDELARLTHRHGEKILKDVWAARNDYVEVILDRSPATIQRFLEKHVQGEMTRERQLTAMHLMEMQRQTQLMYTSCGWFFSEVSGIETVQIMQYAARAIQIAEKLSRRPLEGQFLGDLKHARSNIREYKDGEEVYRRFVKPTVVSFARVVNEYAIHALFGTPSEKQRVYQYVVERHDLASASRGNDTLALGRVMITSTVTTESTNLAFALTYRGRGESIRTAIGSAGTEENYHKSRKLLLEYFNTHDCDAFLDYCRKIWTAEVFTLADMFVEKRQAIIDLLLEDRVAQIHASYAQIYSRHKGMLQNLRELNLPMPEEFALPARHTLSHRLLREVERLREVTRENAYRRSLDIVRSASKLGLALNVHKASRIFQQMLESRLTGLRTNLDLTASEELVRLTHIAGRLKLELQEAPIQNLLYLILQDQIMPLIDQMLVADERDEQSYALTNTMLRLAYRYNFNIKIYKDRLKTVEQAMSQDPRFWP